MDELYYEVMVGPEAFEVVPQMKIVLDRLAVRVLIVLPLLRVCSPPTPLVRSHPLSAGIP